MTASSAITSLISPGRRMWGPNGVSYIYHTVNSGNYRTGGANFTIHEDPSSATNHGPSSSASERTNFFRVERNFLQENVSTPALSLEEGMIFDYYSSQVYCTVLLPYSLPLLSSFTITSQTFTTTKINIFTVNFNVIA